MLKSSIPVQSWMTRDPRTIDHDATLAKAHAVMREAGIRHLPVLEGGKLSGILSQRDLHLIETLKDVDPERVRVHEAMTTHPYFVTPGEGLLDVVQQMAEHKYGAVVVMKDQRVVGLFTTSDALRLLTDLLLDGAEPAAPKEPLAEVPAERSRGGARRASAPPPRRAGHSKRAEGAVPKRGSAR